MPLESTLFLVLVIGALILFAAALAYGDWATRQAMRQIGAAPKAAFDTLIFLIRVGHGACHQSRSKRKLFRRHEIECSLR